ncbi:c-type cytochrome biogenesis protein CcmI [Shimia thalassica]|uniref:c-type cytochrome biogenesis protein CcmI n=1 Tax=Shimia thalassica TaxID=1715693 RepID=UPI0026E2B2CA|nr:c-type cytochrome biogenesis protein CcmI [Shimia thalassica]MDO6480944.1 c-type cytochrome biogenesis protein CcmI [Shimia thalassica]
MIFWIVAIAGALMIAGLFAVALFKGRTGEESPAAYDLRVYQDQLKEVEKDLSRGVINAEDAERIRTEISRRILAADAQLQEGGDTGGQPVMAGRVVAVLMGVVLVGGTAALYAQLGAPGYDDMPLQQRIDDATERHATRLSQAEYEDKLPVRPASEPDGEYGALIEKLRQTVKDRPDDLQGQTLLARNEANLGNVKRAYVAQSNVVRLKAGQATLDDHMFLAELYIAAAEGYVSPEAETALRAALRIEPSDKLGRYYWGLMLIQNGRPDLAFRLWSNLLNESAPNDPWVAPIRSRIQELAWLSGVEYELPPLAPVTGQGLSGPSAEDMQAAQEMSTEDQQEMIRGMVTRLSDRLATEGGSPQEWARLIGALGVLGDLDQAQAIWEEAQSRFAGNPEALAIVTSGAQQAGLSQ